jgi:serine protease AprX
VLLAVTTAVGGLGVGRAGADAVVSGRGTCPADSAALTALANNAYNAQEAAEYAGVDPFVRDDIKNDRHSMYNTARAIGAESYYSANDFGQGVDVAEIDTGVAPVAGLDNGNVVQGPDLSFESQSQFAHLDTYGHGTHLASIIAGRDDSDGTYHTDSIHLPYSWNDPSKFTGIAPAARLVSLKIGDSQGAVDVSQMVAAIDWVVQHAHDPKSADKPNGFNIRVLNLSFGTNAIAYDSARDDELSHAVEVAWDAGIVVVASAGNDGQLPRKTSDDKRTGVDAPAFNPNVLAVGSYDAATGKASEFTQSSGSTSRQPDLLAPGQSILALHDVGASMDDEILDDCNATVAAHTNWTSPVVGPNGRFVHGSGTSQAAAVVSGAAALMLSRNPELTPDQVKRIMRSSATPGIKALDGAAGQGLLNLAKAFKTKDGKRAQNHAQAVGGAGLDQTRGGSYLTDPNNGTQLKGNIDIFGNAVSMKALAFYEVARSAWKTVNGVSTWYSGGFALGTGFGPDPNVGTAWKSADWSKFPATKQSWAGEGWHIDFSSRSWRESGFSGRRWSADSFTSRSWRGYAWHDNAWA